MRKNVGPCESEKTISACPELPGLYLDPMFQKLSSEITMNVQDTLFTFFCIYVIRLFYLNYRLYY